MPKLRDRATHDKSELVAIVFSQDATLVLREIPSRPSSTAVALVLSFVGEAHALVASWAPGFHVTSWSISFMTVCLLWSLKESPQLLQPLQ